MSKNNSICANCQFFRDNKWCSNSKSPSNRKDVSADESCKEFTQNGEKAPAWMRTAIAVLEKARKN